MISYLVKHSTNLQTLIITLLMGGPDHATVHGQEKTENPDSRPKKYGFTIHDFILVQKKSIYN